MPQSKVVGETNPGRGGQELGADQWQKKGLHLKHWSRLIADVKGIRLM